MKLATLRVSVVDNSKTLIIAKNGYVFSSIENTYPNIKVTKSLIMKTSIKTLLASAIVSVSILPATISVSQAQATTSTIQLRSEGFRKCKAQGNSGYTAVVVGTSTYLSSRSGDFGRFRVRSCFQTKSDCNSYLNNFDKILLGVSKFEHKSCKSRA